MKKQENNFVYNIRNGSIAFGTAVQTAPTGEPATVGTTSANPTSATGGAATSDSTPSQPDKNGSVQTGVTATAVMMLVVISGGVLFALAERKKRI